MVNNMKSDDVISNEKKTSNKSKNTSKKENPNKIESFIVTSCIRDTKDNNKIYYEGETIRLNTKRAEELKKYIKKEGK